MGTYAGMNRVLRAISIAIFALLTCVGFGSAQGYDIENIAKIDILPGWRQADGSHIAALRIRLAQGWKTYWRAPGESGIPPGFQWVGSDNLQGVRLLWPVPEVFDSAGMQTIGYHDELILPIVFFPKADGQEITLEGRVALGVCKDVCMPMEANFSAVLTTQGRAEGSNLIQRALENLPDTGRQAGLSAISCDIEPISDGMRITARLTLPRVAKDEAVVFETNDQGVWVSEAKVTREGGVLTAVADLVPPSSAPFVLSRSDIRITVLGQNNGRGHGVDIAGCVSGS